MGPREFDDAGVIELGESEGLPAGSRVALVQTLDFFPPVVDDPTLYGAIAAANSISDVYAMGGRPLSCLTLASLPKEFPDEWVQAIFAGGFDKIAEAGAVVVGGHTVEAEIQFGFSVTGVVEREHLTTNAGAREGDQLYLTKPIGMGTMTTSAKLGKIEWATLEPAALQMATLNRAACEAMIAVNARGGDGRHRLRFGRPRAQHGPRQRSDAAPRELARAALPRRARAGAQGLALGAAPSDRGPGWPGRCAWHPSSRRT